MLTKKRDNTIVDYDEMRIVKAIQKANMTVSEDLRMNNDMIYAIAEEITQRLTAEGENVVEIEHIQDTVEYVLFLHGKYEIAKNYITYRSKRGAARNIENSFINAVMEKIKATNVQNQNANMDEMSFSGRAGEASSVMMKQFALDYFISEKARKNHIENRVYIHDLNWYCVGNHNCLSVPIDDLLAKGFKVRNSDIRPAQSVNTAFQLVAVIFQLQSLQQFGGVSATHIDHTMVPYVRKTFMKQYINAFCYGTADFGHTDPLQKLFNGSEFDEWADANKAQFFAENPALTVNDFYFDNPNLDPTLKAIAMYNTIIETKQAVEAFYHNLNTLQSRSGGQLPFSSINYGTCTLPEGRLITKAILDASLKGIGEFGRTSIFPCGIFQCMKGVNRKPGDPNYDLFKLALLSTAKRLYPNYCNVDWSGNAGYDRNDPRTYFSTMGCRTANGWDINGFGQLKDGRGNICPVTIILPEIAMEAKTEWEKNNAPNTAPSVNSGVFNLFMSKLEEVIADAKDALIERFDYICSQSPDSAKFMYENNIMAGYVPEEGIRSALKHGTLALGQLGLAETLQILIGQNQLTDMGMICAKRIEGLFKTKCAEYKEQYKLNFGVYFTPAENLCYTAMQKFKDKYGVIENVSDKEFFTNSIHVPVWEKVSAYRKIEVESQLTGYSSAGCITYVELDGAASKNIEALESLVNFAMDKDIPYFAVNVPNDMCQDCGYTGEVVDKCPVCGSTNIHRLRRVTGYLTGDYKSAFNKGKQQEVELRVKHQGIAR